MSTRSGGEIKAERARRGARAPPVTRLARVFPARLDALAEVADFVEAVAAEAGFTRHDCLRLTLVLEELFTNTVEHGYGGDSGAPIAVTCDAEPGRVAVTYEDEAPGFDPLGVMPPGDAPPAEGPLAAHLGLILVTRMAAELDYARAEGRNRVSLVVRAS